MKFIVTKQTIYTEKFVVEAATEDEALDMKYENAIESVVNHQNTKKAEVYSSLVKAVPVEA